MTTIKETCQSKVLVKIYKVNNVSISMSSDISQEILLDPIFTFSLTQTYLEKLYSNILLSENTLKDFTDPLGTLRFNFMLKQHAMKNAYLYKATHGDGREVTIFGSYHKIPLTALPEKLKTFLLSFDVLMSEALKQETYDQMCGLQTQSNEVETTNNVTNRKFKDWFDHMPLRVQQDFDAAFATEFTSENVQYYLNSDDMIKTLQEYVCLSYVEGMDYELLSKYLCNRLKQALPLEGMKGFTDTTMQDANFMNTYSFDSMMDFVAQDHYNSYIANGGAKMSDFPIVVEYLNHSRIEEVYDYTVANRNKVWMDNLDKWSRDFPGSKLLVGGVAHLGGKGGLLELLEEYGFTIQDIDLDSICNKINEETIVIGDPPEFTVTFW